MRFSFRFFRNLPKREKKITFSTLLTISRIVLIPFIIGSMILNAWDTAVILFVIASITDVLDGYLARLFNERTFLGACLDPVADKLLMISIFATLAFVSTPLFHIPAWFVWAVLIKEMVLIGGAIMVYKYQGHIDVKPTWLGKSSMAAQTVFVTWLFACYFFHWVPLKTYWVMLIGLLVLVFASLAHYMCIGIRSLKHEHE